MNSGPLFLLSTKEHKPRCAFCGEEIQSKRGRKARVRAQQARVVGEVEIDGDTFKKYEKPILTNDEFCNAACRDAWVKKHSKPKKRKARSVPDFIKHRHVQGKQLAIAAMLPAEEKQDRRNREAMQSPDGDGKIEAEAAERFGFLKGSANG